VTENDPQANPDATKRQLSVASSSGESSQPVGFFGHATKLVSSMLGVSKKSKLELPKSIQLAAAAAKKVKQYFTNLFGCAIDAHRYSATRGTRSQSSPS
jgi:hypothetical protein